MEVKGDFLVCSKCLDNGVCKHQHCACFVLKKVESIRHLFLKCSYSRKSLMDVSAVTGHARVGSGIVDVSKQLNFLIPGLGVDVRAGDLMDRIQSFGKKSNCWSVHWILLGALSWHILQERNRR